MRAVMIILAILGALAVGFGVLVWAELNGVFLAKRSFDDLKASLAPHIKVYRPQGEGPFAAVVQFPGCGGVRGVQDDYARETQAAGMIAVVVDSHTPRGITYDDALKTVCKGFKLRGAERSADVFAAVDLVRAMPDVDPDRIAISGWSHGGWAVMDALIQVDGERPLGLSDSPPRLGVKAAYLTYPYCGFPSRARSRPPADLSVVVDALMIDGDTTAKIEDCGPAFDSWAAAGAPVEMAIWRGVTHAFDEDDHAPHSTYVFDPVRAAEARSRYVERLKEKLAE